MCTFAVYDSDVAIVKGQQFLAYVGTQVQQCVLQKIISVKGHAERKPKALAKGMIADVKLKFPQTLFVDPDLVPFSRIILRANGMSCAAGLIK